MKIAFALRAEHDSDRFQPGVLAVADGSYDLAAALEKSGGTIVVDADTPLAVVLNEYPALKRVPVPDKKAATSAKTKKEN